MNMRVISLALLATLTLPGRNTYAADYEVTVAPSAFARQHAAITFPLPEEKTEWQLRQGDTVLPVQREGQDGIAVLPEVKKGAGQTWRLEPRADLQPKIEVHEEDGMLVFRAFNHELLRFHVAKSKPPAGIDPLFSRSGYIFPLYSPGGQEVLGDYSSLQPHQHGIWSAWSKTEVEGRTPDFWELRKKTGTVECAALLRQWTGPVEAGFEAEMNYVDETVTPAKTVLKERWIVSLRIDGWHDAQPYWVLDLYSIQTCATSAPVNFTWNFYGGVAFRGNEQWLRPEKAFVLDSNGATVRDQMNGSRVRWAFLGGDVDGKFVGIAMLSHPGNFQFPQNVRLHGVYPYLTMTPCQQTEWSITPDEPYIARYRFIIEDGPPVFQRINLLWQDYADPITARLRLVRP